MLELRDLTKRYGRSTVLEALNLTIEDGEFFSLLGPSGCGKTTTLRLIAGFLEPTAGAVILHGRNLVGVPPDRRNTGMVFQNYALFPHLTVAENLAFGLKARRMPAAQVRRRVAEMLELVQLTGFERRPVPELSGGQQQRVALARALAIEPRILLLDEPLSNLDARLREETRGYLLALQRRLGLITVYVTHDQEEALQMSHRIAVLHEGVVQQVGAPEDLYRRPANPFVARFVGKIVFFDGAVQASTGSRVRVKLGDDFGCEVEATDRPAVGAAVRVGIRPEAVGLLDGPAPETANVYPGTVQTCIFNGALMLYTIRLGGRDISITRLSDPATRLLQPGDSVHVHFPPSRLMLFPAGR